MLWCSFLFSIVLLTKEIASQDAIPRTTYTTANLELECEIEPGAVVVGWSKVLDGGIRTEIFLLSVSSGEITDQRQDNEYMNFGHTPDPTSFYNLIISNVTKDDGGTYECDNTPGVLLQFQVDAEVPGNVKIKNGSKDVESLTVTVGEVHDITCSATGTRSKNELYFDWEPDLDGGTPDSKPNGEDGNLTDYTITSTYTPRKDDTSIRCQLMGYALQDEIKDLVFDSISLIVNYKPECSLMLNTANDDCRMVILTCQCTSLPTEIKEYLFYNGSSFMNITVNNTLSVNVDHDTTSEFSCQASNDVGTGEKLNEEFHFCEKDPFKSNTGLIAACSIEAVIIVVLVLMIIFLLRRNQIGYRKQNSQRFTKHFEGNEKADNRAYMDLQELKYEKNRDMDACQLPEENVKLLSSLPGNGTLQYRKALITRVKGDQDGVVKTTSADSILSVAKILRSEAQQNLKLGNSMNIVKLLGWCDTVPTYIIFDYVNGGNLTDHLKEEFSPHRVHMYGNTKKKRFQVSEKGNIERLPNYALQVSNGIQFLTKNRFLHPGLRAKKVLVDTTGICKLYDFVSLENANEWTRLIWNQSVPYQWMPPEFLFLETITSAGDVWSFGVLLWEIFSYGSEPYIGQERSKVEKQIREKELLPLPENCPGAIWQLMITCWEPTVEKRPDIDEITTRLASMCIADKEYQEIK